MKYLYQRKFSVAFATGDSGYVFAERVDPGYILKVDTCLAYSPEREANDNVIIGIRTGTQDILLTSQAPAPVQRGVEAPGPFSVGEGDQLFAYFPDVDNGDTLEIHIAGELQLLNPC